MIIREEIESWFCLFIRKEIMAAANVLFCTELGKFSQAIQTRSKFAESIEVFSEGKLAMFPYGSRVLGNEVLLN